MKELHAILTKYQSAEATLGSLHAEKGPLAPRLGRDLELGIDRMKRRELACYGGALVFLLGLLSTLLAQTIRQPPSGSAPIVAGVAIAGMAWTLEYLRRLSRERAPMDLLLAFCQSADEQTIAAVVTRMQRQYAPRAGQRSRGMVSFDDIIRLHETAILLHLDGERDALLGGIDRRISAAIPRGGSPSAQLLTDLHELNRIDPAEEGDVVLRRWLQNAISMTGHRVEKATFELCLHKIEGASVSDP